MKMVQLSLMMLALMILPGCVSIPPLIQVQHKDNDNNDISRRLDAIDRRLDAMERKMEQKP